MSYPNHARLQVRYPLVKCMMIGLGAGIGGVAAFFRQSLSPTPYACAGDFLTRSGMLGKNPVAWPSARNSSSWSPTGPTRTYLATRSPAFSVFPSTINPRPSIRPCTGARASSRPASEGRWVSTASSDPSGRSSSLASGCVLIRRWRIGPEWAHYLGEQKDLPVAGSPPGVPWGQNNDADVNGEWCQDLAGKWADHRLAQQGGVCSRDRLSVWQVDFRQGFERMRKRCYAWRSHIWEKGIVAWSLVFCIVLPLSYFIK